MPDYIEDFLLLLLLPFFGFFLLDVWCLMTSSKFFDLLVILIAWWYILHSILSSIVIVACSFANAPESARMDWSSFTKGYFLNRGTLVGVLLLVDASSPPQQIDLDCANWLGRNNVWLSLFPISILISLFYISVLPFNFSNDQCKNYRLEWHLFLQNAIKQKAVKRLVLLRTLSNSRRWSGSTTRNLRRGSWQAVSQAWAAPSSSSTCLS